MGVAIDLVINNDTGYLAELGNSASLCNYLIQFINLSLSEKELMRERCRSLGLVATTKKNQIDSFSNLVERLR